MTYIALERLIKRNDGVFQEDSKKLLLKWEEAKNKVIRKTLLMNVERETLFQYMEGQKIWHLPLKGVILSTMYPEFGMRQMSDNDILFDASFRKNVRDWFVTHGYTVKSYEEGNHDEYHNMLFNRTYGTMGNYWRKQVKKVQEEGQDTLSEAKGNIF